MTPEMKQDSDDPALARLWRGISGEIPGAPLDARILRAARAQHLRRRLLPLVGAAMAACLVLALYTLQSEPAPPLQAKLPDTSTFGLYEGRAGTQRADSYSMQQMLIRRMPGGSAYAEVVYP